MYYHYTNWRGVRGSTAAAAASPINKKAVPSFLAAVQPWLNRDFLALRNGLHEDASDPWGCKLFAYRCSLLLTSAYVQMLTAITLDTFADSDDEEDDDEDEEDDDEDEDDEMEYPARL